MRIEGLQRRRLGDRVRIEAEVVYEDAEVPPVLLYYEAGPPLAEAFEPSPDAFVVATFPIAAWAGERRIAVEGALDTTLATGLQQAGALLGAWHSRCRPVQLEPSGGFHPRRPDPAGRATAMFSGGVDATAMLCENRRLVPQDHPRALRTAVFGFGYSPLDRPGGVEDPSRRARYEAQAQRLEAMAAQLDLALARLETNAVQLHPDYVAFYEVGHSAVLLAPLLAAPGLVDEACLASVGSGAGTHPKHGSHPLLDPLYATGAVRVHHGQPQRSRLEKLGLIADWEPAFDTLQSCHGWQVEDPDVVNCGTCEKCVRTMVGLLVHGALPRFTTFPHDDVTPAMVRAVRMPSVHDFLLETEVRDGLRRVGRQDLVRALEDVAARREARRWGRTWRKWRRSFGKRWGRRRPD